MNGRHVVQDVVVLAETPVQPAGGTADDDYDVLDSVPGESPAREPHWSMVAELNIDGSPVRRW